MTEYEAYLVICWNGKDQDVNNKTYSLNTESITIGRSKENTLIIPDKTISSRHCWIGINNSKDSYFDVADWESRWIIKDGSLIDDKNSSNGTYVNGEKLGETEIRVLRNGDRITFARLDFPVAIFRRKALAASVELEQYDTIEHEYL